MNKKQYEAWLARLEEHSFPTPPLHEYLEAERYDGRVFWRISCGHHRNLLDAAVEKWEQAETALAEAQEELLAYREGRKGTLPTGYEG